MDDVGAGRSKTSSYIQSIDRSYKRPALKHPFSEDLYSRVNGFEDSEPLGVMNHFSFSVQNQGSSKTGSREDSFFLPSISGDHDRKESQHNPFRKSYTDVRPNRVAFLQIPNPQLKKGARADLHFYLPIYGNNERETQRNFLFHHSEMRRW